MIRGFGRPQPEPRTQPALHPAEVELFETKARLKDAVRTIDDSLRAAGNSGSALRDVLLDLRNVLTRTATP